MNSYVKKERIKALICWTLATLTLALIYLFQFIYLNPETIDLLFTFVIFILAFSVRGLYQENKDTMLFDMGEVELQALKAQIEQTLKSRGDT